MRRCLDLAEDLQPEVGSERTGTTQHQLVRERVRVVLDPERARAVAGEAIRAAVEVKNNPPDPINVALEMLVKASSTPTRSRRRLTSTGGARRAEQR